MASYVKIEIFPKKLVELNKNLVVPVFCFFVFAFLGVLCILIQAYFCSICLSWREKASTSHGKEPLNSKQTKTNVNYSNSDSDEPLRDITNQQEKQRNRAGKTSKPTLTKKKAPIKHSSKLKQGKNFLSSASRANAGNLDDTTDESSGDDNSLSDAVIIGPTPRAKTTRSIFTKRRHKSPVTNFSRNKNAARNSNNNCYISCQLEISPLFKKGDQKRKRRVLSLSSESE